jgi:hypothetical protein
LGVARTGGTGVVGSTVVVVWPGLVVDVVDVVVVVTFGSVVVVVWHGWGGFVPTVLGGQVSCAELGTAAKAIEPTAAAKPAAAMVMVRLVVIGR